MSAYQRRSGDYPEAVVFEERQGVFWLDRTSLRFIEEATGVRYGSERVGFDREGAIAHAVALMSRGVRVGLRRGEAIHILQPPNAKAAPPVSSAIFLSPQLLLGSRELTSLYEALDRRSSFRATYERWKDSLHEGDLPGIYVYRVAPDMYEVDWRLTGISEAAFQGLALAAHRAGEQLPCRLVAPRRLSSPVTTTTHEPTIYGQLRLAF